MRASLEVRPVCVLALEGLEGEGEGAVCLCMHACMHVCVCKRKKENTQPKGGMGERHAATTQGF